MKIEEIYNVYLNSNGVTTDSRNVPEKSIFFALKGDNFNGNQFGLDSLKKGAMMAVVDEEIGEADERIIRVNNVLETLQSLASYHRDQLDIPIIGITGSNGKTTTKELIREVLKQKYKVVSTIGNLNNHIGVPLTLLSMKKGEVEIGVVEMGANHAYEIGFLCKISKPNFGLITSIGKAHLEGFGSFEVIKNTKKELYDALLHNEGVVFFNADDSLLSELVPRKIEHLSYGSNNDVYCKGELTNEETGYYFAFNLFGKDANYTTITTKLTGKYNFSNALAAACIGRYFQISDEQIKQALENYEPGNNRSQVVKTSKNVLILDAYNANPSSMSLAVENLGNMKNSQKFFILGDMLELGEVSKMEHKSILEKLQFYHLKGILVGKCFYEFKSEFPDFDFFENTDQCIGKLKVEDISDKLILVKGSRGISLERCVPCL
jgi:UDP-N-acetylmuramoyl-tripeptide--D-alanyl-D-alanine ligase